jgi:hypothetical protein
MYIQQLGNVGRGVTAVHQKAIKLNILNEIYCCNEIEVSHPSRKAKEPLSIVNLTSFLSSNFVFQMTISPYIVLG